MMKFLAELGVDPPEWYKEILKAALTIEAKQEEMQDKRSEQKHLGKKSAFITIDDLILE